ncbi:MAG TPA: hypothetical protein VFJ06_13265 [Halococcus sp.]|nr:hypothetical protein [Halococcus sp.]
MATRTEQADTGIGDSIREFVDNHRLLTYFILLEVSLVVVAYYLDTWQSVVLEPSGPDLSDVTAGLLGAWAVVFGFFGVVGIVLLLGSQLWTRVGRR